MRRKENHFPPPGWHWQHQTPIIQTEARKRTATAAAEQETNQTNRTSLEFRRPKPAPGWGSNKAKNLSSDDGPCSGADEPSRGRRGGGFATAAVVADLSGHGLLRRAPRRPVPHPAVRAAARRLLHGPLPAAGQEPQLQVRAVLLWIGQPLFNETILKTGLLIHYHYTFRWGSPRPFEKK